MKALIISVILVTIFLLIVLLSLLFTLGYKINPLNKDILMTIGTVMAPIVAFFALCFFIWQTYIQDETFKIDNRPYLHAVMKMKCGPDPDNKDVWHGPGLLYLKNDGKIPATILEKPLCIVRSNERPDTDLMGYFEKHGGFPSIKIVYPKQDDVIAIPLTPEIGKQPKLVHVYVKVLYMGTDPNKKYWYVLNYLYSITYPNSNPHDPHWELMEPSEYWDKNSDEQPPSYKSPEWDMVIDKVKRRS